MAGRIAGIARSVWFRASGARVAGRSSAPGIPPVLAKAALRFSGRGGTRRAGGSPPPRGVAVASSLPISAVRWVQGAGAGAGLVPRSATGYPPAIGGSGARALLSLLRGGHRAGAVPGAASTPPFCAMSAVGCPPRPLGARGMAKKSGKGAKAASSQGGYEVGVEKVLYSCPRPNRFRLLTTAVGTYGAFSSWAAWNHFYGGGLPTLTGGEAPAIYGVVVTVGCVMSLVGLGVAYQHARRHVASLSVVPGKIVDEVIITSHTMLGGEIKKSYLPHQIDRTEGPPPKGSTLPMSTPWERFRVQGEYGFFLLDEEGEVIDTHALNSVLHGRPVPKAGQAPARKR